MYSTLLLICLLLPAYLVRFRIGPMPTTALEVLILLVIVVWLATERGIISRLRSLAKNNRLLCAGIGLFLLGATFGVLTSADVRAALGEWKAFYIEPVLIFLVLVTSINHGTPSSPPCRGGRLDDSRDRGGYWGRWPKAGGGYILALIISGLATAVFAIYQHFTGFFVPDAFWKSGRVTAWYGFPNAVGLFLAPLWPLALWMLGEVIRTRRKRLAATEQCHCEEPEARKQSNSFRLFIAISSILYILLSPLAIFYAQSTGALVGLAAGIFLLIILYKKTRTAGLVILLTAFLALLIMPAGNPIKQELLARDRSGQIRVAIWKETAALLKDRPILGAGLASYTERIEPYHTTVNGEGIEIFHHPHNIFLTMWVNTGLIGLAGFVFILIWFYKTGLRGARNARFITLRLSLVAAMTVVLVSGMVDSPYIKNDLAVFFWLLPALMIGACPENKKTPLR